MAWDIGGTLVGGASGMLAIDCCCTGVKYEALPASELLPSETGIGFSSLGLFSGLKMEANPDDFKPPFEAASSATREESTEVSICAEDVEAASLAATAAAAAFLLSSSVVFRGAKEITGWVRGAFGGVVVA